MKQTARRPWQRATITEFSWMHGFGEVSLADGRTLPFDIDVVAHKNRLNGLPLPAIVWISLGQRRSGGDRVTSVHIGEDAPELDLGPSVEERLHTLQHHGLLSALDVASLPPEQRRLRRFNLKGHPSEADETLFSVLKRHFRSKARARKDGYISLPKRNVTDAVSDVRHLHPDKQPYLLMSNSRDVAIWLLSPDDADALKRDAALNLCLCKPAEPPSARSFAAHETAADANAAWRAATEDADVAQLLFDLLADEEDEDTWMDAESYLYSELCHQGTFDDLAADAVCVILAWVADSTTPRRAWLLGHIGYFAYEARQQVSQSIEPGNAWLVVEAVRANVLRLAKLTLDEETSDFAAAIIGFIFSSGVPEELLAQLPQHAATLAIEAATEPESMAMPWNE